MTTSNNHEETRQEDIFARPEIAELLKKAKQKNNLSAEEISEMLLNLETDLEPDQIEKLYDKLESFGVGFAGAFNEGDDISEIEAEVESFSSAEETSR